MPNEHHDWIGQRSDVFQQFTPLGSDDAKKGIADDTLGWLYSGGLKTGKDAYLYNCITTRRVSENRRRMTQDYLAAVEEILQRHAIGAG